MASRCNQDGVSALIQASEKGHTEVVRMLLDKDADDDMQDWVRSSPMNFEGQSDEASMQALAWG